jgi:cytochrome c-type biogenesis protein CcmH
VSLRALILAAALALAAASAPAVEPDEILADPALEARARAISEGLRCLVCQNQSIDDSGAPLARDLRLLVRERLRAGDDDVAIVDHIVARYGEFVLLRPRWTPGTYALWLAPALLLGAGAWAVLAVFRRRAGTEAAPLSPDERDRLARALGGDG